MQALLSGRTNVAAYARVVVDRGNGKTLLKPPRALRVGENMGEYLFCDRGFVPTITLVVEREMATKVRYNECLRMAQDSDFAIRLQLAGCSFEMASAPGAVWKDCPDPKRISVSAAPALASAQRLSDWLTQMEASMTSKARLGARGWPYAKLVARSGNPFLALRLFLRAVLHGCYNLRLAAVICLQIFLDPSLYRDIADRAIPWLHSQWRLNRLAKSTISA